MSHFKKFIVAFSIAATLLAVVPSDANADGPLRRWWRSRKANRNCSTCQSADPCGCAPQATTANYVPNAYGLQPGQCMTTCQKTCTRTVVNYVPCTSYRTCYKKVPVTSYKPVTTTDPCTGCTVTCMKPCTTYTMQAQRVPYTTYRPVYRTETYKVPVTTITNNCATGTCGTNTCATGTCGTVTPGCSTCTTGGTPVYAPAPATVPGNYSPSVLPPVTSTRYEVPAAGSTYTGGSGFETPAADQAPSILQGVNPVTSQRPVIDRVNNGAYNYKASVPTQQPVPATIRMEDKTARSPVRKQWNYSPVRLAKYEAPETSPSFSNVQVTPRQRVQQPIQRTSGWVEVK